MKVGLFYQIQVPKPWSPSSEADRIYQALEQIPYAEQQGFESVWFSEHHFRPVWSHNSAPDLTLAAVSQRTSRIRLGIGVVLAPIHHPEPWTCGCRSWAHRVSLSAHTVWLGSRGHAGDVA
jgi:Luciferase-like monooxygenase